MFYTAHYNTNYTDRDEMIKACDASVACKRNLNVNFTKKLSITLSQIDQVFHV